MRRKDKSDQADAMDFSGLPARPKSLTAGDIQEKEFRVSRFGGYKMRDVDEFLDHLTEAMAHLTEENERLRGEAPASSAFDAEALDDASRRADEIIEHARMEAARIVQEARDGLAAAGGAESMSLTETDRVAVGAFLAREREFLQSLATLVQGHAEAVKAMAKAARPTRGRAAPPVQPEVRPRAEEEARAEPVKVVEVDRPAAPALPQTPPAVEEAESVATEEEEEEAEGAGETQRIAPEPDAGQADSKEETVVIEEPEPASVKAREDDQAPRDHESLRELFWGED